MQESGCVKNRNDEQAPAAVAATPEQAGDTRDPWWWVERRVWTERMLTRLASGESADRVWFRLWDKTYAPANLANAFAKVWANGGSAGADAQTVAHFARQAEAELARLHTQLREGTYRPQPVRRVWIPKPGSLEKRPLGIPAVRDRTVQAALRNVLEPIFETEFAEHSYGFRPGRGAKDALRRVDHLLKASHVWVVDADLKSYFDTIPHERLLALVKARVADGPVLAVVASFLRAGCWKKIKAGNPPSGARRRAGSSVPCWRTCISIRSTMKWPGRVGNWCAMRTTSSSSAAAKPRRRPPWPRCGRGWRKRDWSCILKRRGSLTPASRVALTSLGIISSGA